MDKGSSSDVPMTDQHLGGSSMNSPPMETSTPEAAQQPVKKKKTYSALTMPSREMINAQDVMDNCLVKTTIAAVMGGALGVAFGVFSASIDNAGGGLESAPLDNTKSTRVVVKEMLANMGNKSMSYAKGFALFGALYSFNECVIEKHRAKHDRYNAAYAGCATGGMLAYSGGPKAMCMGCASFGAFSIAIEYFMDT